MRKSKVVSKFSLGVEHGTRRWRYAAEQSVGEGGTFARS